MATVGEIKNLTDNEESQPPTEEELLAGLPDFGENGSEDDDSDSEDMNCDMQLGFVEENTNNLFDEPDWTKWDGGKVGGKPVSQAWIKNYWNVKFDCLLVSVG